VNWIGPVATTGTPPAIIARLHQELSAIQNSPELKKAYENEGAEAMRMNSAKFGAFIASQLGKWGKVVKEAGIKPQ
jgi:tripartite-type tricarboxylate transporter receptor subunit TctC